ncbi:MAG: hypothetical protein EOM06_09465 [Sphingobacteriia bacterium]|nr:hypothetical protein [Sphingobacteriia bacterium]
MHNSQQYFSYKKSDFSVFDENNIKEFLLFSENRGLSAQSRNLLLNAIKYYYKNIVGNYELGGVRSAKKISRLPVILSKEEIGILLSGVKNIKHKLLLSIAYGAGLRVSEVISLKIQDIDLSGLTIHVRQAKGGRDRISVLPEISVKSLMIFINTKKVSDYLFESQRGGKLSARTAQKIFAITGDISSNRFWMADCIHSELIQKISENEVTTATILLPFSPKIGSELIVIHFSFPFVL